MVEALSISYHWRHFCNSSSCCFIHNMLLTFLRFFFFNLSSFVVNDINDFINGLCHGKSWLFSFFFLLGWIRMVLLLVFIDPFFHFLTHWYHLGHHFLKRQRLMLLVFEENSDVLFECFKFLLDWFVVFVRFLRKFLLKFINMCNSVHSFIWNSISWNYSNDVFEILKFFFQI